MIIHLFVILIVLIGALIFDDAQQSLGKKVESTRKYYINFICIIFILQSALRNVAVGADTYQYFLLFENVKAQSWQQVLQDFFTVFTDNSTKDAGYPLLEKIFQFFFSDYRMFLFFIAILFFTALARFIYSNTSRMRDAVFAFVLYQALFYDFFSITGLRQTIATALILFCFELIQRRRLIPFLIVAILAATIHKSAFIFIPFYFIANIKHVKLIYLSAIILFPILMLFNRQIALFMAVVSDSDIYMQYATSEMKAGTTNFTSLIFLIAFFGWFFLKNVLKRFPDSYRYFNAFSIAVAFTPLTWVNPNFMRIVQYFTIFMLVLIPLIINSIQIQPKSFREFIFTIMIGTLIFLVIKNGGDYKFFWQDMKFRPNY